MLGKILSGETIDIPHWALSIRQPWAHAVAMGWKPIENRSWGAFPAPRKFRGPFAIHAARGMTQDEYADAASFITQMGHVCPPAVDLLRGGIIGVGCVTDFVRKSSDPWFFGPGALVISGAQPVDFIPSPGALGFFKWQPGGERMPPSRWMLRDKAADRQIRRSEGALL